MSRTNAQQCKLYREKNYPKLQLNLNNGIALYHKCHFETHGWFKT